MKRILFNPLETQVMKKMAKMGLSSGRMDLQKVDVKLDPFKSLQNDMLLQILSLFDDPADIVRIGAVSKFWHDFVIENEIAKKLCLRMFPQLANIVSMSGRDDEMMHSEDAESSNALEWKIFERDHKVYASLLQALKKATDDQMDCIANAISASSTDRYPDESIVHTLNPRSRFIGRASYWSSEGNADPSVTEKLIYKFRDDMCIISEIDIRPFEAYFQPGNPIYSAKSVRFRMGHPKFPEDIEGKIQDEPMQHPSEDEFVWTYISPEFPMAQENRLQQFKLPESVLCIGGYLMIELLGRVQKQATDQLYYICLCHVRAVGRPMFPAFGVESLEPSGKFVLKYDLQKLNFVVRRCRRNRIPYDAQLFEDEMLWEHIGVLENLLHNEAAHLERVWVQIVDEDYFTDDMIP